MDNSHFHPYQISNQTDARVELKISGARKLVLIITWRLLPLFIFTMMGILAIENKGFPWQVKLGLAFVAVVAGSMLLVRIIHRISITPTSITVIVYRFFYDNQVEYLLTGVDHILVHFNDQGRGGAIFYYLKLKTGKKVEFMRQPTISSTREDMEMVSEQLKKITNLRVEIEERKL